MFRANIVLLIWFCLPAVCGAQPPVGSHLSALSSDLAAVRAQAAKALGRLESRAAVPELIEALGDPDRTVRREAAKALAMIKDARAVPPLAKALGDADVNVRLYAAYALGEIKKPSAVDALVQSLDDPQWCVRDQVLWALAEIGGADVAASAVAALRNPDADADGLVWLLQRLGAEQVVADVAKLLKAEAVEVRLRAVDVLGRLEGSTSVHVLVTVLEDEHSSVRSRAVAALVRLHDDAAIEPLAAMASREHDPAVRTAARHAVAELLRHEALAAHWSFDDGGTTVAREVGGREVHGKIHGCQSVEGKRGKALQFGQGTYIELGKPEELPIANRPMTVMAWIKTEADRGVVAARGGAYCGYSLYVKDGVAKFGIRREQGGPGYVAAGTKPVAGRWVHLAGVIRRDRIELYVDGSLTATVKTPGYIPGNCGQGMELGHDLGTSPAEIQDHFQGVIDEIKLFEAALTGEEITRQARGG